MWKKVVPTVALCSFLLVGCNNTKDAIPNNNETPMEDVRDDVNTLSPNTNNGMNDHGNGTLNDGTTNNGTLNDGTLNNGTMDGDNGTGNGTGTGNENGTGNGNVNNGKWIKEPNTELDDDKLINDKDNNIK
ncbi:hypothetical protein [Psychrobacillus sp. BM2]|uniref:hypothetical protein n=1 Tax=Psychrobacillus sp. BM2 TaxID=3400421 RepID=UPI003B017615